MALPSPSLAPPPIIERGKEAEIKLLKTITSWFPRISYVERDVKLPFGRWLLAAAATPLFGMVLFFPITLLVYAFFVWRNRATPNRWRRAISPTFFILYIFFFVTSLLGFYGSCRFQITGNSMLAKLNSAVCGAVKETRGSIGLTAEMV